MIWNKHLLDEIADLRKQRDFFMGKCERLEMALMSQSTPAAQSYVERTEPKPIESTTVELPKKESWREKFDKWGKMTDEERDAAIGIKADEPKPEVV
jgi:hypothetical protein